MPSKDFPAPVAGARRNPQSIGLNMRILRALVLTAIAALVVACTPASVAPTAATQDCPGSSCDVVVKVTGDIAAGTAAIVQVPDLRVARRNRNPVLRWELATPGYEFRAGSIEPKPGSERDWADQCRIVAQQGDFILATNKNSRQVTMSYAIHVWHVQTNRKVTLDPVIFNEGL
jgi:hypothetical protein